MREPSVAEMNWQNLRIPVSCSQVEDGPLVRYIGTRLITFPPLCSQYAAGSPESGAAAFTFPAAHNTAAAAVAIKKECFKWPLLWGLISLSDGTASLRFGWPHAQPHGGFRQAMPGAI